MPLFVWKHDGHNWVIDGTGRIETLNLMKEEGFSIPELPVVYIKAKNEADAKEILLKISSQYGKISQKGFEDFVKGLQIDFEDLGLNIKMPRDIREELGQLPEKPETAITQSGDIYNIGNHRLICGDSTDAETYIRLLGTDRADLLFTDPPYGVSIGDKNKLLLEHDKGNSIRIEEKIENDNINLDKLKTLLTSAFSLAHNYMKDTAAFYVTSPQGGDTGMMMMMMMMMQDAGLPARHIIIWCKNAPTFSLGRLDYDYQHEPILYGWKKTHNFYGMGKYTTSLWHYEKPKKCDLHPTMKPPKLIENAIENSMEPLEKAETALLNSSVKNNIILDIFAGSGSTLIAAEDCKRRAMLIELDPHYCDVIVKRTLAAFPNLPATVERKGKTRTITAGEFSDGIQTNEV